MGAGVHKGVSVHVSMSGCGCLVVGQCVGVGNV